MRSAMVFQSTRPMRGATAIAKGLCKYLGVFQSTRPMRGATLILQSERR